MEDRHGEDQGVFAISIEQAVEYTATRIRPTKPTSGEGSQAQQCMLPSVQSRPTSTGQSSEPLSPNKQHHPEFSPPVETINPAQLFSHAPPPAISRPLACRASSPRSPHLRYASIIHPHKMQELRVKYPKLYFKVLSRNLNVYKDPVVGPDMAENPHRSRINRPKTPTQPPAMTNERLRKHAITAQLFSYRQACAANLFGELEEKGWVFWEREFLDVDAISRDFGQDSRDAGFGIDVDEYIKLQDAAAAGRIKPATQTKEFLDTLDPRLRPPSALRMVRYTDQDEVEEPESEEEEEPSYEEKRAKAIKLAKRDHNKRVALFLADMVIEDARIRRMGF